MPAIRAGPRRIEVTHPDKLLFPDDGITKAELAEYYRAVAPHMVPHVRDRPANLERFPDGIGGDGFFQQGMSDYFPEWIRGVTVAKEGGKLRHVLIQDAATLVYLANQNCITPHVWLSRADDLDHPDRMIFDLDPPEEAPDPVRLATLALRGLLDELGLPAFVKTTGSRGYHVVVPLDRRADFDTVREFARDVASVLAARHPDELTTETRKQARRGRIYIDTLRNAYAHTAVPPYAVRARPGAPVAAPVSWEELEDPAMHPQQFTLRNILERLEREGDPWRGLRRRGRSLARARKRLGG